MQINLLGSKKMQKMKKVFAIFMLPVFVFQMVSANLLLIAMPVARAADEVVIDSVAAEKVEPKVDPEPVEKEAEKAVEKTVAIEEKTTPAKDAEPISAQPKVATPEVAKEKTETVTQIDILKSPENKALGALDSTEKTIVEEEAKTEIIPIPANPSIDPEAASIERPVIQQTTNNLQPITNNKELAINTPQELWAIDGARAITNLPVELGKTYVAPQNKEVTVIFTSLPENPGTLSIEEVKLTDEQVKSLGALSNIAYDVTSSMTDGTFKYSLTLPKPKNAKNVEIKFAETASELDDAQTVPKGETKTATTSVSTSLDHFTIFFPAVGAPPLINAFSFATKTGDITNGDTVNINLTGVTQADLDTIGNITVSEDSDLRITLPPVPTLPNVVHLDGGANPKTLFQLFGFTQAITPQDLANTAAFLNQGGLIPVVGTLTDSSNNVTNIHINILMVPDTTFPTISALSFATKTGAVVGGDTVNINDIPGNPLVLPVRLEKV